jgi:hypothetical protein
LEHKVQEEMVVVDPVAILEREVVELQIQAVVVVLVEMEIMVEQEDLG